MQNIWDKVDQAIPKYELEARHIANVKALLNRQELLNVLPKNGIIAELGVNRGEFSQQILDTCSPKKLHLVDVWETKRYNQGLRLSVEKKFTEQIESGQIELNLGLSTEVVDQFENQYFDWIYIDTNHLYDNTIAELKKYDSKMKPGGIIAGHDYVIGNWNGMVRYGVIEAVYEFCSTENWEIIYLTMENKENQSFAIRKI
ncbi:MAG: class I SAM-dependent methyltransferase [Reichenbachiella sp.]